jgi:hypothetical protein
MCSPSLLIEHCQRGTTHSLIIGGGTFKSTVLATSLLTCRKSIFCLDPKVELADLVGAELERRGRKVIRPSIGDGSPNVSGGFYILDETFAARRGLDLRRQRRRVLAQGVDVDVRASRIAKLRHTAQRHALGAHTRGAVQVDHLALAPLAFVTLDADHLAAGLSFRT